MEICQGKNERGKFKLTHYPTLVFVIRNRNLATTVLTDSTRLTRISVETCPVGESYNKKRRGSSRGESQ
jgi:hypothetical protein